MKAAARAETPASGAAAPDVGESSYFQILRSSILIGGSSAVVLVIAIIRTKATAVLLGPAGMGLAGLFSSVLDLATSLAGMGMKSSGVRQIAAAVGTGDSRRIALTVTVLRRAVVLLGLIGAALLAVFAEQVSQLTFGTAERKGAVVALSFAVFLTTVAGGQSALLQGLRRIADLARMSVWGALAGTVIGIPLVYFFREDGIVPSLITVAAASVATSWLYSRRVRVERATLSARETASEAGALLKLGLAFMSSGLLMMGAAYVIRIIVRRDAGLEAAGFYQAAWMLGGLYVGFILQAMGTDFYPRLVGACNDHELTSRIVNEQAHVSMLLAAPGVLATLTFAPLVLTIFYSAKFHGANEVLRWICLGMALRVITWPMGFIVVAQGRQFTFFATELAWTIVSVGSAWYLVKPLGLIGAGISFFISYVFHGLMLYPIVRLQAGFRWTSTNLYTGIGFLAILAIMFLLPYVLPALWSGLAGAMAVIVVTLYSVRTLAALLPPGRVPKVLRPLANLFLPKG